MGLMIHSLDNIPKSARRDFFVYLLDYGWQEPISQALRDNFDKMAEIASKNKAVVIKGTDVAHFESEVMSWHQINNENAEELLPALLITNKHPEYFRESNREFSGRKNILRIEDNEEDIKLILVPFKRFCKNTSDVVTLIEKIFNDIIAEKDLSDFRIAKEMNKGVGKAIVDSIILEPNFSGLGFSFNKLKNYLKG
jgi:hypothetical protein